MAGLRISVKANFRDERGRFMAVFDESKFEALNAVAMMGAAVAFDNAPSKTGALKAGIEGYADGNVARVFSHDWKSQLINDGAPPHPIIGSPWLKFWWDREGREFKPGFRRGYPPPDIVKHPGFRGFGFMDLALAAIEGGMEDVVAGRMSF